MMRLFSLPLIALTALLSAGCAATSTQLYRAAGGETICDDNGPDLGCVVVLPEAAWRSDQKEPDRRESMALAEIRDSFKELPCGRISMPGGIEGFSNWSGRPEAELLQDYSSKWVDTVILLRIEELTPRIFTTFSLPFLWGGTNEADFRIRALSTKTGAVLTDMRVKRSTGGPFNIRPAEWSGRELNAALRNVIGSE